MGWASLLIFGSVCGQAQIFSLAQVLDSIKTRNPGLKQYEWKAQASKQLAEGVKAWEAPQAGAGLSEFPYPSAGKVDNQMAAPRKMVMIRIQQMFPNLNEKRGEQAYYQSFTRQYLDEYHTMENNLFSRARDAYFEAWVAEKKLAIIDAQEKQIELLIQIAEGRLAYNKANPANIYKAKAALSDLRSRRINLNSLVLQASAEINGLMYRPVDAELQVDTTSQYVQNTYAILQADSLYLMKNRSDFRFITDQIQSLSLQQKVVASRSRPHFGITWDNMRMASGMYMYNIMAMVTIPIAPWSSRGYQTEVKSLGNEIRSMQDQLQDQVSQALGTVRRTWLRVSAARKDLEIYESEVIPAYEKAYQADLNAYGENMGDIYETLDAWNEVTQKKMDYYDKLDGLLHMQVQLQKELQQY
ncbi:MAG: TolC family protein [Bacteroidota bacterium]|nr:TolC family protein [Bacteroidota bacterium]